jgi:hypothetical protein
MRQSGDACGAGRVFASLPLKQVMHETQHEQLLQNVEQLRQLVAACSTETIVGACTAYWIRRDKSVDAQGLSSPARQWTFLLGLMLSTPEPTTPNQFGDGERTRSLELLEKIFSSYACGVLPKVVLTSGTLLTKGSS